MMGPAPRGRRRSAVRAIARPRRGIRGADDRVDARIVRVQPGIAPVCPGLGRPRSDRAERKRSAERLGEAAPTDGCSGPYPSYGVRHVSVPDVEFARSRAAACRRSRASRSVIDRVADDRAGHAVAAATSATEFGADDGDDFDPRLPEQRIGVSVAVIGEDDAGRRADEVGAAVPLGALAHVVGATRLDYADRL